MWLLQWKLWLNFACFRKSLDSYLNYNVIFVRFQQYFARKHSTCHQSSLTRGIPPVHSQEHITSEAGTWWNNNVSEQPHSFFVIRLFFHILQEPLLHGQRVAATPHMLHKTADWFQTQLLHRVFTLLGKFETTWLGKFDTTWQQKALTRASRNTGSLLKEILALSMDGKKEGSSALGLQ